MVVDALNADYGAGEREGVASTAAAFPLHQAATVSSGSARGTSKGKGKMRVDTSDASADAMKRNHRWVSFPSLSTKTPARLHVGLDRTKSNLL